MVGEVWKSIAEWFARPFEVCRTRQEGQVRQHDNNEGGRDSDNEYQSLCHAIDGSPRVITGEEFVRGRAETIVPSQTSSRIASGVTSSAMSPSLRARGRRSGAPGLSRGGRQDYVGAARGRQSTRLPPAIRVPPLSAYASGKVAVAGNAVVIGETIPEAEAIPNNFPSTSAYLKAMQAHVQHEFAASVREGVTAADRKRTGGWMPLSCRSDPRKPDKLAFFVDGNGCGHDFSANPWSRHVIEIEGETVPALVVVCSEGSTTRNAILTIASARGFGRGGVPTRSRGLKTRVRSLGFAGPFLQQYGKAAMLLKNEKWGGRLLSAVALLGRQNAVEGPEGTFLPAEDCALDTSLVPLNPAQRDAVLALTGGLDIIVGPPGTGKSTTIFHVIDSRVRQDARVLVTSTRNQAVDAVTEKIHTLGVLVFGNDMRLGKFAKQFTIDGRLQNDPELVFWRHVRASWAAASSCALSFSWREQHLLPNFPGISRLRNLQEVSLSATGTGKKSRKLRKRGRAAGLWAFALETVLQASYDKRLKSGNRGQRRMFRQLVALGSFQALLRDGGALVEAIILRLELLTRLRLLTTTMVFVSTIDSAEGSLRRLKRDIIETAAALRLPPRMKLPRVTLDTVIMDEATCVLETAVPVLLSLGIRNLTLVGDHNQLRPFSRVRDSSVCANHSRSLMERAINSGLTNQFLDTQYRMHPKICDIVSTTFYNNRLFTSDDLKLKRRSHQPCKWIHVGGGEKMHKDRGYSNPSEIPSVVKQARAAMRRYGAEADIRVITFYNMQKDALERAFEKHGDLKKVRIVSVDSCQGSDADVIIISTVRSGGRRKLSGFMKDSSRVNVAISRAKQECIFVGDRGKIRSGGGAMWRSVVDHYTS